MSCKITHINTTVILSTVQHIPYIMAKDNYFPNTWILENPFQQSFVLYQGKKHINDFGLPDLSQAFTNLKH